MREKDPVKTIADSAEDAAFRQQKLDSIEATKEDPTVWDEVTERGDGKYRELFESLAESIFIVNTQGRFVDANRTACQRLGYSRAELLELSVPDISLTTSAAFQGFQERLVEEPVFTFETYHRRKDGTLMPVEIVLQSIVHAGERSVLGVARDILSRKQTEEALRAKTEEIEHYFSTALDLFCIANTDGYFVKLNVQWEATLGYSLEELQARPFFELIHPDDREAAARAMDQLSAQKQVLNLVNRYRCKDGSYRWIEWRSIPKRNLIYAAARDITERREAEELLRFTQFAVERMSDAAYWMWPDGRFFYVNEAACRALGYSREELSHMGVVDIDPDVTPEIMASLWQRLRVAGTDCFEARHTAKDGRSFPVEIHSNFVVLEGREYNCAFARDITERKLAEDALRTSEAKLRSILRAAPVGIGVINHRVFLDANDVLCEMTGYERSELVGHNARLLYMSSEEYARVGQERNLQEESVMKVGAGAVETRWRRKDGAAIDVLVSAAPLDVCDFERGLVVAILDITQRKKAESGLRQRNEELAALNQLVRSVISQFSVQGVCRVAAEHVGEVLKPDLVVLYVRYEDGLRRMAVGPGTTHLPMDDVPVFRLSDRLCGLAAQTIRPTYVVNLLDDPRCRWDECIDAGLRSFAAIPLRFGNTALGVLGVGSTGERNFETTAAYLETAADQLAMSLHSVQLLEQTRAYAGQLQEAMAERDLSQATLRKRQEEVTRANLMLKNVLDNIPVRVFWKDRESRYLGCNALFARDAGYERPELLVGKDDYDLFVKEDAENFRKDDQSVIEGTQARIGYEEPQLRPDGIVAILRTSKVPMRDIKGAVVGVLGTYEDITERKHVEDALKNSEDRLREVVARFSGVFFQFYARPNGETGLNYVSEQVETVFGISRRLDGFFERITALVLPECRQEFIESVGKAVANATEWRYEGRAQLPSGKIITFSASSSPVKQADELVFNGVMLDVTQQRRAEEERALNTQRTHALLQLNQMTDAPLQRIMDFALEEAVRLTQSTIGYLAFLNDDETVLTMHSWSKSAMKECAIIDKPITYPVEDTGLWGEAVRQRQPVITNDYSPTSPWVKGCPPGHVPLKRHMNIPVFAGSRIVLVAGVGNKEEEYDGNDVQQLTLLMEGMWRLIERKQTREEREKADAMLHAAFSQSPFGILIADAPDVRIRWANPAALRIRGASPTILTDIDVSQHSANWRTFRPDGTPYPPTELPLSRAVLKGETTNNEEVIIRNEQGEDRWVLVNAAPVYDAHGVITAGLVILHDFTEQKKVEAERKKLEAQLRQAQKMEAVGQLAGGVAHDFNNLLQVIFGNVDIMQSTLEEDSSDNQPLEEVRKAAERAASLTRQLLAFSRRQIIQPTNFDLNEVVQGVLKMIRRIIGEHIELRFSPCEGTGTIFADKGQIEQILMNLCVNARDAMPTGGTLTIETGHATLDSEYCRDHPWAAVGRYVRLVVTDTGYGMDEATRTQIFEPFFTTKEVGNGTGLGLATVYGIVKQHNGLIHVYSEPGMGSVFKVYLRASEQESETTEQKPEAPASGGSETILVAEDEAMVRTLVCNILEKAGYTVLKACDGEDALRVFDEHADTIDMALLDVMMPKLGGRGVMDRVRANYPRMRFLFSSGYSESAIHTDFVIKADVRLITKPYRKADLLRAIRETLDAPQET